MGQDQRTQTLAIDEQETKKRLLNRIQEFLSYGDLELRQIKADRKGLIQTETFEFRNTATQEDFLVMFLNANVESPGVEPKA